MELIPALLLGIGLSAAVGFRIFVPFLLMSLASNMGLMELSAGMTWMGSTPALIAFATATLLEVGAYFVPWLDNLLDSVTTPAAFVGGTVMMSSAIVEMDPLMHWALAIIAGGGTAGIIKGGTSTTRLASTATTGGLANPLLAGTEIIGAVGLSIMSMFIPIVAGVLVLLTVTYALWRIVRWRRSRRLA